MSFSDDLAAEQARIQSYTQQQSILNSQPTATLTNRAANLYSADQHKAPYTRYYLANHYHKNTGKLLIPVAGPTGPADIVQVSAPYGYRWTVFAITRPKIKPVLPAVEENVNQQLLYSEIVVEARIVAPDGITEWFSTAGYYRYGLPTALGSGDTLPQGAIPPLSTAPQPYTAEDFKTGIQG